MTKSQLAKLQSNLDIIEAANAQIEEISEVKNLRTVIEHAHARNEQLRAACKHENADVQWMSNTGNYDGYQSHWVIIRCPDCYFNGNFDSEEEAEEYKKWSMHRNAKPYDSRDHKN